MIEIDTVFLVLKANLERQLLKAVSFSNGVKSKTYFRRSISCVKFKDSYVDFDVYAVHCVNINFIYMYCILIFKIFIFISDRYLIRLNRINI